MNARLMIWAGPGRTAFNIAIALLALATSARCGSKGSDSLTGADDTTGTMSVIVLGGSPSGLTATVILTGPESFPERTATTVFGGTLTFTSLPPGAYTVATTIFGFSCQPVSADVRTGQIATANISCTRTPDTVTDTMGTITGAVTSDGSPIGGVPVKLSGPGVEMTRITSAIGTFVFRIAEGEYTVTTFPQHFACPAQNAVVAPNQTTTANIACTPNTTGAITGTISIEGAGLDGATVTLSGPESRTAISGLGNFSFGELPPGTYTVAATAGLMGCHSVNVDVEAARTTTVQISCVSVPRDYPLGSEIQGNWEYGRQLSSQTGSCPLPLPESGSGSMTFNSSNNTIAIVGLDPNLTIIGPYDEDTGLYTGTGSAVLGDGSSVQTDVIVTFAFPGPWSYGGEIFFHGASPPQGLVRRHHDPGGNLVCTEMYTVGGDLMLQGWW